MSVHQAAGVMPSRCDNDKRCQRRHFNDKNSSNIFFGTPKAPAEEPEVNEDPEDESYHPVETDVSEDTPEASDDPQDPEAEEDPAEADGEDESDDTKEPDVTEPELEPEPDATEPEAEPDVIETPQDRNAYKDPFEHRPVSSDFKKKKSFFN